jgi:hypothetical protein
MGRARLTSHAKIGGGPAVFPPSPRVTYQPTCKPGSVWPAAETADVTAIPLVRRLPGASSNLPERLGRTDLKLALRAVPIRSCSRWGLPCRFRRRKRGALLPHRFTLTAANTLRSRGGLFSVALSLKLPRKGPPRRTLSGTVRPWSPDFPPRPPFGIGAERPSGRLTLIGMGSGGAGVKQAAPSRLKKARTCREGDRPGLGELAINLAGATKSRPAAGPKLKAPARGWKVSLRGLD